MFGLSCRAPTCFPTPQACQMTPSLEPATCGPQWSLLVTLLLTTILMRSPHRTARNTAWRCWPSGFECTIPLGSSSQSSRTVLKERMGRQSTLTFEFSPTTQSEGVFDSRDTAHTHTCTVCVCAYTHWERETTGSKPGLFTHLSALMQTDFQFCSNLNLNSPPAHALCSPLLTYILWMLPASSGIDGTAQLRAYELDESFPNLNQLDNLEKNKQKNSRVVSPSSRFSSSQ